jgi:long-chain acyl-CoA synthetase
MVNFQQPAYTILNLSIQNIMKLAQGEYVALEKIENSYASAPVVAQLYVHGDSLQSYLLAIVVPDLVQLAGIASKISGKNVSAEDMGALVQAVKDERVKTHILQTLTKEAKRNGLKGCVISKLARFELI